MIYSCFDNELDVIHHHNQYWAVPSLSVSLRVSLLSSLSSFSLVLLCFGSNYQWLWLAFEANVCVSHALIGIRFTKRSDVWISDDWHEYRSHTLLSHTWVVSKIAIEVQQKYTFEVCEHQCQHIPAFATLNTCYFECQSSPLNRTALWQPFHSSDEWLTDGFSLFNHYFCSDVLFGFQWLSITYVLHVLKTSLFQYHYCVNYFT